MKHVKLFSDFLDESLDESFRSGAKFQAIYNYAKKVKEGTAKNPKTSLFSDSGKTYEEAYNKIKKLYEEAKTLYDKRKKDFYAKFRNSTGSFAKGHGLEPHDPQVRDFAKYEANLDFAIELYKDAIDFMDKYNKLYNTLKDDMVSDDHELICTAAQKLAEIYPWKLVEDNGKLKTRTTRYWKADALILRGAISQVEGIRQMYNNIEAGTKLLGKSEKQVQGMKKQSIMQSVRWAM